MMKAFDSIRQESNIDEEIKLEDSDSDCERAFKELRPGIPFKLREVLDPEQFNPHKLVKESQRNGYKIVPFTHSEQL